MPEVDDQAVNVGVRQVAVPKLMGSSQSQKHGRRIGGAEHWVNEWVAARGASGPLNH